MMPERTVGFDRLGVPELVGPTTNNERKEKRVEGATDRGLPPEERERLAEDRGPGATDGGRGPSGMVEEALTRGEGARDE